MVVERTYNVPLRKEWLKAPKYKRAKKAMTGLREFLAKHTKSDNIKIGKYLNLELWKHGMRNPPHHVKVSVVKEDDGLVKAELFGKKYEEFKKVEKKEKTKKEQLMEKLGVKGAKEEEKKEEKKEEPKVEEKKEEAPKVEEKKTEEKPKEEVKPEEKPAEKKEPVKETLKEEPKKEEKKPEVKPKVEEKKPEPAK